MTVWQPIATAPKDGTVILLMRRDAVGVAAIGAGSWGVKSTGYRETEGWISYNRCQWFLMTPTHWTELPEDTFK